MYYHIAGKVDGKKIWRIVLELNIGGFILTIALPGHYNYTMDYIAIRQVQCKPKFKPISYTAAYVTTVIQPHEYFESKTMHLRTYV
jgi:hypothetical protein